MNRRKNGGVLPILLLILLLLCLAVFGLPHLIQGKVTDPASIQESMGVSLPPEAGEVTGQGGGFADKAYSLTFTLPETQFPVFLEQLGVKELRSADPAASRASDDRPRVAGFPEPAKWAKWSQESPVRQWELLVSKANEGTVQVYLYLAKP